VIDLVPYTGRLFTVGRLDMSSEGLILVTNDGALADRLTHPRYGVTKTYQVEVAGSLDRKQLETLRKGVHLAEGFARVVSVKVVRQYHHSSLLEMVLAEGRNREIRRVLAKVGHKVERLRRIAIGPLRLADLPTGHVRQLDADEVRGLQRAARGGKPGPVKRRKSAPKRKPAAADARPQRVVIGGDASAKFPGTRAPGKKPAGKKKVPSGKRPRRARP
jgi:23S rRNA pseudouridine2605 synthase